MYSSILLADDDFIFVRLLRGAVESAKLALPLFHVEDGEEAKRFLSGTGEYADRVKFPPPAIFILDLHMPGLRGLEVLEWVRGRESLRNLLVIVISSGHDMISVNRAYELGARACMAKPGNLAGLRQIAQLLNIFIEFARILDDATRETGAV